MGVSLQAEKLTHPGLVRDQNEDYCDFRLPSSEEEMSNRGALFVVADGMGGSDAGKMASLTGGVAVIEQYYGNRTAGDVRTALREAVWAANAEVREMALRRSWTGAGSTVVCAVIRGDELTIGNVGDSRGYLIRGKMVSQLTEDHTWVHERVKAGQMTAEQAATDRRRNAITRSLGNHPDIEVDISQHQLVEGDAIVLCTDGLTGASYNSASAQKGEPHFATPADIRDIVLRSSSPSGAAKRLIELALKGGGSDNITAIVIFYGQHRRTLAIGAAAKPLAIGAAALLALAGIASAGPALLNSSAPPSPTAETARPPMTDGGGSESNDSGSTLIGSDGQPLPTPAASAAPAGAVRAPTSTGQPTATQTPVPTSTSTPVPPTHTATPLPAPTVTQTSTPAPTATRSPTPTATTAPTATPPPPPPPPSDGGGGGGDSGGGRRR